MEVNREIREKCEFFAFFEGVWVIFKISDAYFYP